MVGLSWGGGAQLGGTRNRWGVKTLVLRAVCCSEVGGERRKEVCLQPPKAVRKQGPSSLDLFPGPLGPPRGGSGLE